MKRLLYSFVLSSISLLIFIFAGPFVSIAHAETHITSDTQFNQTVEWSKEGSPYILDSDIDIPRGTSLSVGPGVVVTTSSSSPGSLYVGGTLSINGTADQPVTIENLTGFWVSFSTSTITHAIIDIPTGLTVLKSNIQISSTTITDADKGIDTQGSAITISDSSISGNRYGIYSRAMPPPVFQALNDLFGFGIAQAQTVSDNPNENHLTISSSSIVNNNLYGIYNSINNVVNAQNNWWGNSAGPGSTTAGAAIYGNVAYAPWLTKDPAISVKPIVCCSNVLFLPGIESSRLYLDQKSFIGTSTNELWEPNRNADVEKLFMTPTGQSINSGIYTKDIIDSPFGLSQFSIYKGFIAMMNSVVADKTINSWLAYPYDWRFDVQTTVSQKLINTLFALASTSKTGKVTIVAHSNGGLVAKLLAKTLADRGQSGLLDKVILVAVPQLGTPQAITGLLHGDNESLLGGIITSQNTARQLGENMPSGYGLLPSRAYFSNLLNPLVSFTTSALADFNFVGDGQKIMNYDTLRNFLGGVSDHRIKPADSDTDLPTLLHTTMIDSAQKIHDLIDTFSFASTTKTIALAGWGKSTVSGVSYYEKTSCSGSALTTIFGESSTCVSSLEHSASTTILGDGTVVMVSAIPPFSSSSNYYFDLGSESKGKLISDAHATILSTNSAVAFVKGQVTDSISDDALPPYISNKAPTMADVVQNDLVVSVHSPVELNIYDSQGRHTGPISNPDPTSDLGMFETGIPGSEYVPNDGDTYVRVPYGTNYKVTFTGTGMGSFEVDTEHDINGVDAANTTFADMPVTPLLKAELVLATTTLLSGTTTKSTATSTQTASSTIAATTTQMILFDFDGDGKIDATSTPHSQYDPVLDMESYQEIISTLKLSPYKEKTMYDKLGIIIDCLRKKRQIKEVSEPDNLAINTARKAIADLQNQHWVFKDLDSVRKQKLEDIFQAFLDDVDTSQ